MTKIQRFSKGVGGMAKPLNFFVTLRFATTLEETCPKEQRKEIDWVACNPFSFTQVLGISNVTQTLMGVLALQGSIA